MSVRCKACGLIKNYLHKKSNAERESFMKHYISKITCFLLSACLLAGSGCGKEPGGKKTPEEFNESDIESSTGNDRSDQDANDIEIQPNTPENKPSLDDEDFQDASSAGMVTGSDFPLLENYRERGIALHPDIEGRGESFCSIVQNSEGEMEYFTVDPAKVNSLLWKYTLNEDETSWERESVTWAQGLKGKIQSSRITVLLGEDQNYYAYYCDEAQQYHFVKQEGDSYREITIPDWDITVEGNIHIIPGKVCVAENGNIIMADQGYECFIYNPEDGQTLDHFRCGWYESMCVEGNELFITDRTTGSVMHYDAEELKQLPLITGNFKAMVRIAVSGDDIYACDPNGIFRANKNGGSFQKILDAGKFHFSKENGNPLKLFMRGDVFYIFFGEEKGVIKKYAQRNPEEEFIGTLTVYSLKTSELLIDMVAEFQMQHPEIDVFYETGEGSEGSVTTADCIRALNARILAGDGPDILVLDDLPVESYIKQGLLADLEAAVADVKEEITPNILSQYTQGNKIYQLPVRFMVPIFITSGQDREIFQSLSALVEYCEQEENPVIPAELPYTYLLELLYYNFPPELRSKEGEIEKENIVEFLSLAKRFCDAEHAVASEGSEVANKFPYSIDRGYLFGVPIHEWTMVFGEQEALFACMTRDFMYYPDVAEQRGGEILGNNGKFLANGMLGINARSQQKELAELFVKAAFSEKMQSMDTYNVGFPVHKKVLEKISQSDYSNFILGTNDSTGKQRTMRGHYKEEAQYLVGLATSVQVPIERNLMVYDIIKEEAYRFLNGQTELSAAAEEIVNRLQLYYFEQ